jgi:hypothetical protein
MCNFHLGAMNYDSPPSSSAAYLRQSILLSAFETPETRSLYNIGLKNVAGKIRNEKRWPPVEVPDGIDQVSTLAQFCSRCLKCMA